MPHPLLRVYKYHSLGVTSNSELVNRLKIEIPEETIRDCSKEYLQTKKLRKYKNVEGSFREHETWRM